MSEEAAPEVTPVAGGEPVAPASTEKLGWRTELPESLRGNEVFAGYQTKNDLWNGHIDAVTKVKDLEGKLGSYIPKLTENATDEQKAAYRAALGIPDKAEDYEIELIEGMENDLAPWFKETALKLELPKDKAKALSAEWNNLVKAAEEQSKKAHNDAMAALTKEWGADAAAKADAVKAAYEVFANQEIEALLKTEFSIGGEKIVFGNHPAMVRLLLDIGKKMQPDSVTTSGINPQPVNPTGVFHYDWGKTNSGG